ncbi:protein adenylyltransferase SelO [Pseudalkalibacillus berkeleyi]|uniref:Protein nucleotidyltransferase YdiU n=1 Tax=Pseudalkalibacillus berkeleyi TaxID=1069813 RepID=A0ABS9H5L5_9BACL|nr:YdiU family protein [Pseudalkalibacillus berkeleyi]MCF6139191.1 YdiU family protein [Pseudalkalibacillus berkeleyi]
MTQQGWQFDNSYAQLPKAFFSKIEPNPVREPKLIIFNEKLADKLGLDQEALQGEEGVAVFAGNDTPEGGLPLAQAYAGHQFGNLTMLGDGRAMMIGEHITPDGKRFDIQLKGSGRTPYSRGGDGRASLGPMLREYIISEAMHGLGIPTTRSLAVVTTGEPVYRETELQGAILTRVASSHIRVGTFQYAAGKGDMDDLKKLAEYTIDRHYSYIKEEGSDRYLALLKEVMKRQAELIAKWQLVGFIHGVMNTDNMTLSGETIDYGPCAFMDTFDPATVFSSIDTQGRYAYRNQPAIGAWNLARFAETLLPLLHEEQEEAIKIAENEIGKFADYYYTHWLAGMRKKLGLFNEEKEDETLFEDLLNLMKEHEADYTNTFLALTFDEEYEGTENLLKSSAFEEWKKRWLERLGRQEQSKEDAHQLMKDNNPALIPRNHRVEEALEAAVEQGDYSVMERLLEVLSEPYAHTKQQEEYCNFPPDSTRAYQTYCGT